MSTTGEHPTEALLDGRYHLGAKVGEGGAASVYRAEDRMLRRTVAVKVLHPNEAGSVSEPERAQREAAVLAGLSHPSLVTLYDARLDPGHARYLTMEFIDGPTLASRLTHGPLTPAETAMLAHDIARALQVVHKAGVIHRDVKPSNILLAPPVQAGRPWTAKLTDFGIAHELADTRATSPGIIVGTAAYMAPEQVRSDPLTPATDVYSLGLVLIESLTATPAFPLGHNVETALTRLARDPDIPDSISPGWQELLRRMTRSDPAERPSASAVVDAAHVLADGRTGAHQQPATAHDVIPVLERGDDRSPDRTREYPAVVPPTKQPPPPRRKRVALLAAAGVLAASAGAISWSLTPQPSEPAPASTSTVITPTPTPTPTAPPLAPSDDLAESGNDAPAITDSKQSKATSVQPAKDTANQNKGPGNNSGNTEKSGKGKDKKK